MARLNRKLKRRLIMPWCRFVVLTNGPFLLDSNNVWVNGTIRNDIRKKSMRRPATTCLVNLAGPFVVSFVSSRSLIVALAQSMTMAQSPTVKSRLPDSFCTRIPGLAPSKRTHVTCPHERYQIYQGIRSTYDGPVAMATDLFVWNLTKDDSACRRPSWTRPHGLRNLRRHRTIQDPTLPSRPSQSHDS